MLGLKAAVNQNYTGFKIFAPAFLFGWRYSLHVSFPWLLQSYCCSLNSVSLFSNLQSYITFPLLFCLIPSVLLLQLRYLTSVYRGFGFSSPASFSPGAVGASLFPAALHASQKNANFEPAFGLMAMLKNIPLWSMKDNTKQQCSP